MPQRGTQIKPGKKQVVIPSHNPLRNRDGCQLRVRVDSHSHRNLQGIKKQRLGKSTATGEQVELPDLIRISIRTSADVPSSGQVRSGPTIATQLLARADPVNSARTMIRGRGEKL